MCPPNQTLISLFAHPDASESLAEGRAAGRSIASLSRSLTKKLASRHFVVDEMRLVLLLLLQLLAAVCAQIACNNAGPRNDCGYVGITPEQCAAKSKRNLERKKEKISSFLNHSNRLLLEPCESRTLVLLFEWTSISVLPGAKFFREFI